MVLHFWLQESIYNDSVKIIDSIVSFKDEDDKFIFISKDDKDKDI